MSKKVHWYIVGKNEAKKIHIFQKITNFQNFVKSTVNQIKRFKCYRKVKHDDENPNPRYWTPTSIFEGLGAIFHVIWPKIRVFKTSKIRKLSKYVCLSKIYNLQCSSKNLWICLLPKIFFWSNRTDSFWNISNLD